MINTFRYKISIVLDADDMFGQRKAVIYSAYTGQRLGEVNYDKTLEHGTPDEIDDYVSSNLHF